MAWEVAGEEYGVKTIAYSFHNHKQEGKNPKILTKDELEEGYFHARMADKTLKRNFDRIQYPYVRNLLARNWFQVKNSEAIFAVGYLYNKTIAEGGTGWAVQMAIDNRKPVWVYDQVNKQWWTYLYKSDPSVFIGDTFVSMGNYTPYIRTHNFAGIGTRDLTDDGINVILEVYRKTFHESQEKVD